MEVARKPTGLERLCSQVKRRGLIHPLIDKQQFRAE
jgi:hypothetical protein